jgi:serine/threonine protein kinase
MNLCDELLNVIINNKYKIINILGNGSFSTVYTIMDIDNNDIYALKKSNKDNIINEYNIYASLKNLKEKSNIYNHIIFNNDHYLMLEKFNQTLENLFKYYKKFSINTINYIGINILNILKIIHKNGYIYQDIKPQNFVINNKYEICIIDFGLSKKFIHNKKHIKFNCNLNFVGNIRYASINAHLKFELSRRDDIESLGYMLIHFILNKLPWQQMTQYDNIEKIITNVGNMKLSTNLNNYNDIPKYIMQYLQYSKSLNFIDKPNYKYLHNLLYKHLNKKLYDWNL